MSSSPRPVRAARVIRRPGAVLPPAPVVHRRAMLPPSSASDAASIESMLEEARQEGYEAGARAGLEEATSSLSAQRAAAVAALADHIGRSAERLTEIRDQVVDEVVADAVDLVVELLAVLVGRELALGEAPVRDAVVRALALAPDRQGLVIRVHPDCGLDDEEIAALGADPTVEVVRDEGVDPSGCQVMVGPCRIDAQLPAALERVRQCLETMVPGRSLPGVVEPAVEPAVPS